MLPDTANLEIYLRPIPGAATRRISWHNPKATSHQIRKFQNQPFPVVLLTLCGHAKPAE